MKAILPILLFALTACSSNIDKNQRPWAVDSKESETPVQTTSTTVETGVPFVVHEWGTYTSLQGSNGETQDGMHYEDESLPAFVYGRVPPNPTGPATKQVEDTLLDGITQKLETPVIYFYDAPETVDVTVEFPKGVVSQWYPNARWYAPEIYSETFSPDEIEEGSMSWRVNTHAPADISNIIDVPADDVWAPSRNVPAAQTISVGDEFEKFIFYRGLGRFEMPVRVTTSSGTFTISNDSDDEINDVYLLHWDGSIGEIWPLGAVGPGAALSFSPTPKELPKNDYLEKAKSTIVAGLVADGLTEDESWAMVETWERSYFETPGWRVLYVAPRLWTDEILPLQIDPKPDELVRTLIGRIEVFTDVEEQEMLSRVERGETVTTERFAEAKLQRLLSICEDDAVKTKILEEIVQVRTTPLD